jgi:hypothetical protein
MSPVEWHYTHGDRQAGPIPSAELKQLADAGELLPNDLVWREGMEQWVAARNVKGLFEATSPKAPGTPPKAAEPFADIVQPVSPIPASAPAPLPEPGRTALDRSPLRPDRHLFDIVLAALRAQFTAQFVDSTTKIFVTCGHYCLYVAMLAGFSAAVTLAVKTGLLDPLLRGAIWLLALAVLQYASARFCVALDRLIRTTAGNVSTTVFLDSFALANMAAGLAILLGSAVLAVRSDAYSLIFSGLVLFIVCEYLAVVSLNPETLSISIVSEATAGEEAIGVLSFLLKAVLRLSPVAFGAGVLCGTLWLLCACYLLLVPLGGRDAVTAFLGAETLAGLEADVDPASAGTMLEVWPGQVTASRANQWILGFAAIPCLAYVFFLLSHLLLDVIRAVLPLPARLDTLAEGQEQPPAQH